ncbi:hypothetical protein [Streptomyces luteogriseus]|uniref:hypothetical protein n=1 Tax=Streptomyces luteogriseus TaxID=68233 RepID=UPI0027D81520|nr:hypothetical protein [Streptomyces luteogriseus]
MSARLPPGPAAGDFHGFRAAITARRTAVDTHVIASLAAARFWPTATIRECTDAFLRHKAVNLGAGVLLRLPGL